MSSSLRRIASHLLWTPQGWIRNPIVDVDPLSGEILRIERCDEGLDALCGVEFYSGVLCPGFVNAHCHLELSHLRGMIGSGGGFAAFADAMARLRNKVADNVRHEALAAADEEMWREGIVGVGDISNDDFSFEVKRSSRIAYHTFGEVFGLKHSNLARQREFSTSISPFSLTPHSTYSVTEADFRRVAVEGRSPLSLHFMESPDEAALFEGRGRLHDWYARVGFECDFLQYGSPARRIVASVPRDRSIMLVHNCFVRQEDIDIIMEHFEAPVWWVLCPRSNRFISSIEPSSVELLRRNRLNICIGTDSLASNRSLSILEEMKCFEGVPLAELIGWATTNGAKALGMGERFGSIEVGKRSGINLISGIDFDTLTLRHTSTIKRLL